MRIAEVMSSPRTFIQQPNSTQSRIAKQLADVIKRDYSPEQWRVISKTILSNFMKGIAVELNAELNR